MTRLDFARLPTGISVLFVILSHPVVPGTTDVNLDAKGTKKSGGYGERLEVEHEGAVRPHTLYTTVVVQSR